jgi:hypothetical protein
MVTKKSIGVIFGILLISGWVLGSAVQAGAETLNYKAYHYAEKNETSWSGMWKTTLCN